MQDIVWGISASLMLVIIGAFLFVAMHAPRQTTYEEVKHRAAGLRAKIFWVLAGVFFAASATTLPNLPYLVSPAGGAAQQVEVTASQWHWQIRPEQVTAGIPVVFNVTSSDVNHGFGIYDEKLRLVGQTQAMPGYVNRLEFVFPRPGAYRILCLEYCGLTHHDMATQLTVVAAE